MIADSNSIYILSSTLLIQDAEKKAGHSTLLADKPDLYEILVDDVKPEKWEEYLKHKGRTKFYFRRTE